MGKKKRSEGGLGGLLGGLGILLETLSDLAEQGKELRQSGEFGGAESGSKIKGVYGFTVRTGLGKGGEGPDIKVEPFGNVHKDEETGRTVVQEVREPLVDVFEEPDHVQVIAELPGVGHEDIHLELHEDILTLTATQGDKKYRKEILLPAAFSKERMSSSCRNGVLEVRLNK